MPYDSFSSTTCIRPDMSTPAEQETLKKFQGVDGWKPEFRTLHWNEKGWKGVEKVEEEIAKLTDDEQCALVKDLSLFGNRIRGLPASFLRFQNLTHLNLGETRVRCFPSSNLQCNRSSDEQLSLTGRRACPRAGLQAGLSAVAVSQWQRPKTASIRHLCHVTAADALSRR